MTDASRFGAKKVALHAADATASKYALRCIRLWLAIDRVSGYLYFGLVWGRLQPNRKTPGRNEYNGSVTDESRILTQS